MQPAHNKYAYRSRVSECKFRHLVKCFALDTDATRAAIHSGLSRVTVNRYYMAFRNAIYINLDRSRIESGSVELDESYFGAKRIRGKRGRGAFKKKIVFGIFERGQKNKVQVDIVKDCTSESLIPIISERIAKKTIVYTDGFKTYYGLPELGYKRHYKVNHGADEFSRGRVHVNGIESFWAFAKRRLVKFCGVSSRYFNLHLAECEFRFNLGSWENIYRRLLQIFFRAPLFAVSKPKKFLSKNPMTFSRFRKLLKFMKVMNITKKRKIFSRLFSRLLLFCIFLL